MTRSFRQMAILAGRLLPWVNWAVFVAIAAVAMVAAMMGVGLLIIQR